MVARTAMPRRRGSARMYTGRTQADVDAALTPGQGAPGAGGDRRQVADHVDHVAKVAGYDHVGIGGDLDGIRSVPTGLTGVQDYPNLFAELIRRGWSDENLAKLAGGNILRVLRQAEAVSKSMANEPPACRPARRPTTNERAASASRRDHPGDAAAAELHPAVVHGDDARRLRRSGRRPAAAEGRRRSRPV